MMTEEALRRLYGPFEVGELLSVSSAYFGMVFRSGPRRFWLVHESGDITYHSQDYKGFHRATFHGDFQGDTEWHDKVVHECEEMLRWFEERCEEWKRRRNLTSAPHRH